MNKTLIGTEKSAGTIIRRCFVNKVFRKIAQDAQEKTCAGVSSNEVLGLETCSFI